MIDDVTTDLVATPNTFIDTTTQTRTDEETGYTIETTNTITGIKAKVGLWTPSYLSALGQNSSRRWRWRFAQRAAVEYQ